MESIKKILIISFLFFAALNIAFGEMRWAAKVIGFSSQLSSKVSSAEQILGPPSVMPGFGLSPCSWMPRNKNNPRGEWIAVTFDDPIRASQVAINENHYPGSISRVIVFDTSMTGYIIFEKNISENLGKPGRIFSIRLDKKTDFKVYGVKLELNLDLVSGIPQFDAIAVSDTDTAITAEINEFEIEINSEPVNLGSSVNSGFSEVAPIISYDSKKLYFTRGSNPDAGGREWDQNVWYSERDTNGGFKPAVKMGPPINNERNNWVISVSPDRNTLILGNIYKPKYAGEEGISISHYTGDGWTFPEKIEIKNFYNLNNQSGFCLGGDGKTLYQCIERYDTYGGLDVYVSFLLDNGTWTEPMNLGPQINTAADEISPFIAADGVTLYFSTSGYPGYGSNDMFITKRLDTTWENWSRPMNLGKNLNTNSWDAYYTIPASGDYAYFVSSKNTFGKEDIFRVLLPESLRPEPVVLISGKVLNAKTGEPLKAKIKYEILPDGKEAGIARSNPRTGEYLIVLPAGKKYGFMAETETYIAINENLDLTDINSYKEIHRDLSMVPIEAGQTVLMNNIFFEFGKHTLLEDSYSELNRIKEFLEEYPNINIAIHGHTDSVGTEEFNLELSKKRAESVAQYLTEKGIGKDRVTTIGYGESKPKVPNKNEEYMKINRRVEFLIK